MAPPLFSRTLNTAVSYDTTSDTDGTKKLEAIRNTISATGTWRVIEDNISAAGLLLIGGPVGTATENDRLLFMAYDRTSDTYTVNSAHIYGSSYSANYIYVYCSAGSGASSFDPADLAGTGYLLGGTEQCIFSAVMAKSGVYTSHVAITSDEDLWMYHRGTSSNSTMYGYGRLGYDQDDTIYRLMITPGAGQPDDTFWALTGNFLSYSTWPGYTTSTAERINLLDSGDGISLGRVTAFATDATSLGEHLTLTNGDEVRPNIIFSDSSTNGDLGRCRCFGRQFHAGPQRSGEPAEIQEGGSGDVLSIALPAQYPVLADTLYLTEWV